MINTNMGQRQTTEMIYQRLHEDGRGIRIIGIFTKLKDKTMFECSDGHQWETTPDKIIGKARRGCPHCYENRRGSSLVSNIEEIREKLHQKKITIIGDYVNARTKTMFECSCGNQWEALPDNLLKKSNPTGCPSCAANRSQIRLSEDEVATRISTKGFKLVGAFKGASSKTKFECRNGHQWITSLSSLKGCSACADYGFNPEKPAWEYGFIRDGYLKLGITNNLEQRLSTHRRNGDFDLVHIRHHSVGHIASDWEKRLKRKFGGKFVTKEQCPDGWTETFPLSVLEEAKR